MNIFAVDRSPLLCARALDDKRLRKMILETAQILCTVLNLTAESQVTPYKNTHINNPVILWAKTRGSRNWTWLLLLAEAYSEEYLHRFKKRHASMEIVEWLREVYDTLKDYRGEDLDPLYPTGWYNAASHGSLGISFRHLADTHLAYRLYLNARWKTDKRSPVWTLRSPPKWAEI